MRHVLFPLALAIALTNGCTSRAGLPDKPLILTQGRYGSPALMIDGSHVGEKLAVKSESVLTVDGRVTRLSQQTFQRMTNGLAFHFRCNDTSLMKTLDREWQVINLVSNKEGHEEFATELDDVISFHGTLRIPKHRGEYELYLSIVEFVREDDGTEMKARLLPILRTVLEVE